MKPFHQGQLDCFCAAYAVLNAMRLLHALPISGARQLFNSMIVDLAEDLELFSEVAFNATDHTAWVERLIADQKGTSRAMRCSRPFQADSAPARKASKYLTLDSGREIISASKGASPENVWACLKDWLNGGTFMKPRTAVLRFHRYLAMSPSPVVSHWSTAERVEQGPAGEILHLADASTEATAIHSIALSELAVHSSGVDADHLLLIEPSTIFLLERA